MLRASLITDADWAETLKRPWRELVAHSDTASPFQTWEWQSSWWNHFRGRKKPLIIAVHEGNDLVGLVPFYSTTQAWRVLRAVGMGHSDYLHPLALTGLEAQVSGAIAALISGHEHPGATGLGFDLLDWHQIREGNPTLTALQERPDSVGALNPDFSLDARIEQATCLVLDLPTTYDEYLKTLGKSLRYDAKRRVPNAKIVKVNDDNVGKGLDVFFDLHQTRWKKRGLPGAFLGKKVKRFHEEWARKAIASGFWRMSLLELEGKPVGAIYAMSTGKTCYFYQAGFDPAAKAVSPGTLLVAHTIREAIESGMTTFDFLRGDEPYKRRWMPQHEYRNYRLLVGTGFRGKLGLGWNEQGSRIEARIRARFEGKGLV